MELSFVLRRIILGCWQPELRDTLTHHGVCRGWLSSAVRCTLSTHLWGRYSSVI